MIDRKKMNYIFGKLNYSELSSKSAEVAFFLTLSIFPFLMFTVSAVAYIPALKIESYVGMIERVIPGRATDFIVLIVKSAVTNRDTRYLFLSFAITMWSFSRAVKALIKGMNRAFLSPETRSFIKVMFISFVFTLVLVILIFSSMILLVYGEKLGHLVFDFLHIDRIFIKVWDITRYVVGTVSTGLVFCLLYKYTPNIKLKITEVIPGAVFATLGWFTMSFIYSFYTNNYSNYEVIYGSFEEVIVLLTWIYLSSWVIVIGYEINSRIYKRRRRREGHRFNIHAGTYVDNAQIQNSEKRY